ncbi:hypothetical protein ABD91_20965 [Lysinibacillus sphaericus]|uniref:hypothetical protein n=1 Tax=Lysinibacillus sphaericus TaxID=1421 RepID=UPI0018CD6DC9|nr:hypothetical protein [Lysinibacillus sphaericus]MBG9693214.1 hypothetical protein [Lysinibacillus sphaericus]
MTNYKGVFIMFWYTKDELINFYEKTLGKNYYGDAHMKCHVMILRKTESMLPYAISKAGIRSGEMVTVYINREEIYFKSFLDNSIVKAKLDTTLGKEIINCLAFIDKNPTQAFYTLLVYPDSLSIEANKLIDQYAEVEKTDLSAEDIGLDGMAGKAFLVNATITTKKKLFGAFSNLSKLVEGADSRMVTILPNIEPAEYQFYYRHYS